MEKIVEFNKNMVIYVFDKTDDFMDNNVNRNMFREEAYINYYKIDENGLLRNLKKTFNKNSEILIREELDKNKNPLLVEVFMERDFYNKGNFVNICDYLSKTLLKMAS